ncbi:MULTISPECIES: BadF/BadG/BcrA/BcrD ATPase family protein [unclassified Sphingomonas]|uniref:BadF/BadG/BcrA/BcrD ATPase family protein n=1 Tax=Sphingomonas TaxID=13687 RepID=UPI000969EFF4|nr:MULTISPECIES: BadF/BadG/BcrA/BcrD ATPase family protein [unclassified Sphingomonas]MBN8813359.1 ATPase [Sphingomonas sp.]OJY52869.1 MAG: ATPase [Sphingomonas sp. 67-41]
MAYFLGIDAGGSHCRSRLTDELGTILGTGESGPANTRIGIERLHAVLRDVAGQAVSAAGLDDAEVATIRAGMGIAGISRPGMREQLAALPFPFAAIEFVTDAAIANLGAHAGVEGATLIIGTGSVAEVRVGTNSFTIGGYGFPISDEGSGAALGLSAMRHALRALDGRSEVTPLSHAVTAGFGHDTARAVAWMDAATPKDYAAFAPLVMDYAENNDAIARSIVEDAAQHIERFIETIFARGAVRCALAGGLAMRIRPWLRARTVARLVDAVSDPLDGALLLAGLPATALPTRKPDAD